MMIEVLKQVRQVIWRYRHETPLGNQPYMIAHEADETINRIDQAIAELEKQEHGDYLHQENDGCPVELSVLQRFWRGQDIPVEHQPSWFKQEPVAWLDRTDLKNLSACFEPTISKNPVSEYDVPLYTSPQPRKPLTEEEIEDVANECENSKKPWCDIVFARALEAKHGIGDK
jgi:hypothetical protein